VFVTVGLSSFLHLWQGLLGIKVPSVAQPEQLTVGVQIIDWGEKFVHWFILSCDDIIEQVFGGGWFEEIQILEAASTKYLLNEVITRRNDLIYRILASVSNLNCNGQLPRPTDRRNFDTQQDQPKFSETTKILQERTQLIEWDNGEAWKQR
jgi:hypothetical protein